MAGTFWTPMSWVSVRIQNLYFFRNSEWRFILINCDYRTTWIWWNPARAFSARRSHQVSRRLLQRSNLRLSQDLSQLGVQRQSNLRRRELVVTISECAMPPRPCVILSMYLIFCLTFVHSCHPLLGKVLDALDLGLDQEGRTWGIVAAPWSNLEWDFLDFVCSKRCGYFI
jgi:hypothetical protein